MKNRLATILCLGLLFFPKSFSNAKTGNFSVGIHAKTSYVRNADKALKNYFLFNDPSFSDGDKIGFLRKEEKENEKNLFKFSKIPVVAGLNFEYSTYFTDKFGLSFHGNFGWGNILVVTPIKDVFFENLTKTGGSSFEQDEKTFVLNYTRKISVLDLGGDVRIKYDLFNSSLDFNDYARNSWVGSLSLGFKNNWLILRDFCSVNTNIPTNNVKSSDNPEKNENKISSERINCWFPGVVLGFDVVFGWNLGVGLDVCYYFRNLFTKNDRLVEGDKKFANDRQSSGVLQPTYDINCHFLQGNLKIYYDFGAFINNHEDPSEIDIEKW